MPGPWGWPQFAGPASRTFNHRPHRLSGPSPGPTPQQQPFLPGWSPTGPAPTMVPNSGHSSPRPHTKVSTRGPASSCGPPTHGQASSSSATPPGGATPLPTLPWESPTGGTCPSFLGPVQACPQAARPPLTLTCRPSSSAMPSSVVSGGALAGVAVLQASCASLKSRAGEWMFCWMEPSTACSHLGSPGVEGGKRAGLAHGTPALAAAQPVRPGVPV